MTKIVAKLEDRGLVRRTPHPTDGRQVILAPTEQGTAVLAQHRAGARRVAGPPAGRADAGGARHARAGGGDPAAGRARLSRARFGPQWITRDDASRPSRGGATRRAGEARARTFQSLQVRNYRLFAIGQLVKLIGVWMMFTAQDWLVLDLSGNSPTALGVVTALQFLPVLLLTLLGRHGSPTGTTSGKLLFVANAAWAVLSLSWPSWSLSGVGAALARLRLRRPARHRQRRSRRRYARRSSPSWSAVTLLPNALALVRGHVQHRPDRRPGARRRRASPLLDVGPVFLLSARRSPSRRCSAWSGCARPSCTATTCRRRPSAPPPASSTACGTSGAAPTCCCRWR